VLLEESVNELLDLGVDTLSVSMSTSIPETATAIYEWADVSGRRMTGIEMAKETILRQLAGIRCAADAGIHVKVNSVLIPEVNNGSIAALAEEISSAGAELQNIMPLVPCGSMMTLRSPTCEELEQARIEARRYIRQFSSCRQCRADVVGIPGADTILRRC
jgi:nitrogen fixation protein NifB